MSDTRPYFQVEASTYVDEKGDATSKQAWVYYYPRGDNRSIYRETCMRYARFKNGTVSIDQSSSIAFPSVRYLRGWCDVPQGLIMEFFLVFFEKDVTPEIPYVGEKYYD